ncbi:MAG: thioredoxin-dependent thiol peroxidase [Phascolarctobacterium sp.]
MLAVGTVAPAFTLPDKEGNNVSLSDFAGKKVVLYFYPKDSTPGCTRQAQAFRDAFEKFVAAGAIIIGISKDSVKSHLNFATKQEIPFILLSDTEHTVLEAYEVWQEKKLYGKVSMGVVRSVYVIDEEGKIAAAWTKVKPEQSAVDALDFVCSCGK